MDEDPPRTRRVLPSLTTVIKEKLILFKRGTLQDADLPTLPIGNSTTSLGSVKPPLKKAASLLNSSIFELKDKYTVLYILCETQDILIRTAKYSTGQLRVLKSIKLSYFNKRSLKLFKKALSKFRKISSPYIARVYEYFIGKSYIHIAIEYCSGPSLNELTSAAQSDSKQIHNAARQISMALNCLARSGIGLTRLYAQDLYHATESLTSPIKFVGFEYIYKLSEIGSNPEPLRGKDFCYKIPVWDMGVILVKLLVSSYDLYSTSSRTHHYIIWKSIVRKLEDLKKIFPRISVKLIDFLYRVIEIDASKRPSPYELLQHPWLETSEKLSKTMQDLIVGGLLSIARCNKLQLDVLKYITTHLLTYTNTTLAHQAFVSLDKHFNCAISFNEILNCISSKDKEDLLFHGFNKLANSKKFLKFDDFLLIAIKWGEALSPENISIVFSQIVDSDSSNVTRSRLNSFLSSDDLQARWQEIISNLGPQGSLNRHQFYSLVKGDF
jgi:serine/threonine protein kinase